jgi:hypothetical protein
MKKIFFVFKNDAVFLIKKDRRERRKRRFKINFIDHNSIKLVRTPEEYIDINYLDDYLDRFYF